jgi:hypothetical protein
MADHEQKNASNSKTRVRKLQTLTEHQANSRLGRELLAYCLFLILFCVVTVTPVDDPNYEGLTYAIRNLMLEQDHLQFNTNVSFSGPKFTEIRSVSDYWKWFRGPFLHAIYMTDW